jgi:hypothetical protein
MVFHIQQTVFEKIVHYKKLLAPVIGGKTDKEIRIMLVHCKDHQLGRKKWLTEDEQIMNKFVFLEYPEHIQKLLREKKISMRTAQRMNIEEKKMLHESAGNELMK